MLKFSEENAKTRALRQVKSLQKYLQDKRKIYSFDLISGWSCPFANQCLSKVHIINGRKKIRDGKNTKFRCFSASQEALYNNVYNRRMENYTFLKQYKNDSGSMAIMLTHALPKNAGIVRIHVAGDFFNENYFYAWLTIAEACPDILFYAYTKSLPYWINYRKYGSIPENFILTASRGGQCDNLIKKHRLREAIVVFSEKEAKSLGLEIDHDDSHAADWSKKKQSFALLLHGIQPAGSQAASALRDLKGKGSYKR